MRRKRPALQVFAATRKIRGSFPFGFAQGQDDPRKGKWLLFRFVLLDRRRRCCRRRGEQLNDLGSIWSSQSRASIPPGCGSESSVVAGSNVTERRLASSPVNCRIDKTGGVLILRIGQRDESGP